MINCSLSGSYIIKIEKDMMVASWTALSLKWVALIPLFCKRKRRFSLNRR